MYKLIYDYEQCIKIAWFVGAIYQYACTEEYIKYLLQETAA